MQKKGIGMGGFMGAMGALNDLQDAYQDPKPVTKKTTKIIPKQATTSTQVKKNTTTNLPVKKNTTTNLPQKKTTSIQQQQQQKPNNSQNILQTNSNKQQQIGKLESNSEVKLVLKPLKTPSFDMNLLQNLESLKQFADIKNDGKIQNHFNILYHFIFNDDYDFPIYDFSDTQQNKTSIEEVLNNCAITQQEFRDPDFQPLKNLPYKWNKITDILDQYQLFNHISSESVIQGSLGDCYLMSSIGVLSEKPFLITRLFKNKTKNEHGVYQILMNESGMWKKYLVDDYFPCSGNQILYCKPKNGDIYAMLLEKVYAKIYGGFKEIEVGFSADSMKDLTGAVSEYIDIKKDASSGWNQMQEGIKRDFLLTASSKDDSESMVSKHCYGVLALKQVEHSQKIYKFVQIRNPYGQITGSSMLDKLPTQVIQKLGEDIKQPGGILWMYYEDFRQNFEVVTISKVHQGYSYSFMNFDQNHANQAQFQIIQAEVAFQSHTYISLHEKHSRFYKSQNNGQFKYSTKRVIVFNLKENGEINEVLGGDFNCKQSCFVEINLQPGKYLFFVESDQNKVPYTVSCYSQSPVSMQNGSFIFENDLKQLKNNLVQDLIIKYVEKQSQNISGIQQKEYDDKAVRKYAPLFGYVFIYYQNYSLNSVFYETIEEFPIFENLASYVPSQKSNIKIVVQPGKSQVVLFKIGNNNNCSHKITFKSKSNFSSLQNNNSQSSNFIESTIKNGQQKQRISNVNVFTVKNQEGFIIVYQNLSSKVYKESTTFKTLQNLKIIPQMAQNLKLKTVSFTVQPNQTYWIKLQLVNPADSNSKFACSFVMA